MLNVLSTEIEKATLDSGNEKLYFGNMYTLLSWRGCLISKRDLLAHCQVTSRGVIDLGKHWQENTQDITWQSCIIFFQIIYPVILKTVYQWSDAVYANIPNSYP